MTGTFTFSRIAVYDQAIARGAIVVADQDRQRGRG